MTKNSALYSFFASFGLPAYEENSVYDLEGAPAFPYITFQSMTDTLGNTLSINASLWYRSTSWADCNVKAEEISAAIGYGGKLLSYDGGAIWIKRSTPFAQNMGDDADDLIKRKLLTINIEYLSE